MRRPRRPRSRQRRATEAAPRGAVTPSSRRRGPRDAEGADRAPERGPDLPRGRLDQLRRLHDHARSEGVAEDDGVVRSTRAQGLLRRHRLPPDRARLRDPGRRSDGDGHRRARLPDRRHAGPVDAVHARDGRDGEGRRRAARHVRQPVLRRHRRRRRASSRLRRDRQGDRRPRRGVAHRPPRRSGDRDADAAGRRRPDARGSL